MNKTVEAIKRGFGIMWNRLLYNYQHQDEIQKTELLKQKEKLKEQLEVVRLKAEIEKINKERGIDGQHRLF